MARTRNNRRNNKSNKRRKLGLKLKKGSSYQDSDPVLFRVADASLPDVTPSPAADVSPEVIRELLDPYVKEQLIDFLVDAVADDPDLLRVIRSVADASLSHRKLFVFGLGWDATKETLTNAFESFGPIEDCNVVVDKASGRNKGYGFVVFKSRAGALKALEKPDKTIGNRVTQCQLAALGNAKGQIATAGAVAGSNDISGRKVYVGNLYFDVASDRLRTFFAQFGEIESGPFGFDKFTGKPRGYAIFVYKTLEGARKALEEPEKMIDGNIISCRLASDSNQKGKTVAALPAVAGGSVGSNPSSQALLGSVQQPALAAVAAAQNLALLYGQNQTYAAALLSQNPGYAAMLSQNPLLAAAALNPAAAAMAMNPAAGFLGSQNQALTANAGVVGTLQSYLGAYGSQGLAGVQGSQMYQDPQFGATPSANPGTSFGGYL